MEQIDNKVIFFDLETTGLDMIKDEVIQIAAVATTGYPAFDVLEMFEAKLPPTPTGVKRLWEGSSYRAEVWESEQVVPALAWRRFFTFLKRHATVQRFSKAGKPYRVAQLAGHNVATFDKLWVWRDAKALGLFVPAAGNCWDTVQLAITAQVMGHLVSLPNLRLTTLAEAAGRPLGADAHEALADVRATVDVARWLALLLERD